MDRARVLRASQFVGGPSAPRGSCRSPGAGLALRVPVPQTRRESAPSNDALRFSLAIGLSLLPLSGCGGGAATLYPAHTLAQNQVTAGAGVSNNFAFSGGEAVTGTQATPGAGVDPEQAYVEDRVRRALLAPGVAPWVAARVGLGGQNEGGLTYTSRTARVDARHAFQNDEYALSVGLGASAVLMHPGSYSPPPPGSPLVAGRFTDQNAELHATGWGLELPVIAGWRSSASVLSVWGGARAGFERISGPVAVGEAAVPSSGAALTANLVGSRLWAGGLVGFAVGVKPIWVAVELDAAYQAMSASADFPAESGSPPERQATLKGVTVAPTGALIGKFW